jgi:hypothetical protein
MAVYGTEWAAGYDAAARAVMEALQQPAEFDPGAMTMGEAEAFRAGWEKARQQAADLLQPEHEGIVGECCAVSIGVMREAVLAMEPEA